MFKCLQKSYELLSDPERRQQYDSVDPLFDESIPAEASALPASKFFATYAPVFERNARFSRRQPVPALGDSSTARADVEAFYTLWFAFDSWRRFEYLDEEENVENREERRFVDRKNKAQRVKKKTEDNARISRLVQQAYKLDPRVAAWRDDDRRAKEAKKTEREDRLRREQERLAQEAAAAEAERVQRAVEQKRVDEEQRRARQAEQEKHRSEKRRLKRLFVENGYFVPKGSLKALEARAVALEKALLLLTTDELALLCADIERVHLDGGCVGLVLAACLPKEQPAPSTVSTEPAAAPPPPPPPQEDEWSLKETDLLIKACKLFPGGTVARWEQITEHINRHVEQTRTVDQVVRRANEMRRAESAATAVGVQDTVVASKRDPRVDLHEPTVAAYQTGTLAVWTPEEQKLLEKALKAVPATDPERWERIADTVGTRSRKECMLRAKEIAVLLRQKRTPA